MALPTEIPLSKKKIVVLIFGSMAFTALGIWLVVSPPHIQHPIFGNPILMAGTGYTSLLFFGAGMVMGMKKLVDNRPGLILDDSGLTIQTSLSGKTFIPWEDMTGISEVQIQQTKLIRLHLRNPEEYIAAEGNFLKRRMARLSFNLSDAPYSIAAGTLQIGHSELLGLLNERILVSNEG
jgi:hypothetical protein